MNESNRKIKSFVIRTGRMTAGQTLAYESMMPDYGVKFSVQPIDFYELFGNSHPVTLEIGFGMGASLVEQASMYPEINFLGIEVHRPGAGALLSRMQERGVSNIRVITHDAVEVLELMIANDSLDKVQLFFPDPWHKTRHRKRRIIKSEFIKQIKKKLVRGGIFHMATDWEDYAKHMLQDMQQETGWKNLSVDNGYVPKPDCRPVTKFQRRGERLGHGVWDLMFQSEG